MVGLLESLCMFYMVSQRQSGSARLRCINCSSPDEPLYRAFLFRAHTKRFGSFLLCTR